MKQERFHFGSGSFLLLVLTVFMVWAAFFELDQTVHAQGQIIPRDRTQVIQVADGGVLQGLHVAEGQSVKEGELLAVLEKQRANAAVDEVNTRIATLEITRIRALAEATGTTPTFGEFKRTYPDVVAVQRALYQQNRVALDTDLDALKAALALADEENTITTRLYDLGDVSRVELMKTQRQLIEIQQKIEGLKQKFKADARKELARIGEELSSQRSRLQERQSVLDHTDVLAPMDGVIKFLRVTTVGGVLRAGDELMQISPTQGGFLIEAKVNPADIGQLQLGMPVSVRLDAYDYTVFGSLAGTLVYLSSDTLSEQGAQGQASVYYRAQVRIDEQQTNPKLSLDHLKPGMTASLDIQTGRRSVLAFLAKPVVRAFTGAMTQK